MRQSVYRVYYAGRRETSDFSESEACQNSLTWVRSVLKFLVGVILSLRKVPPLLIFCTPKMTCTAVCHYSFVDLQDSE